MEESYDPVEWKYDRIEWKYDRMEEKYDPVKWKYDRMEERFDPMEHGYDPMECKSRLDCIFVQNALHNFLVSSITIIYFFLDLYNGLKECSSSY